MVDVVVPKLGLTITSVEIIEWLQAASSHVNAGDPVVLLNADKTEVEVEAPCAGVLSEVLVDAGDVVAVGALLARIDADDGGAEVMLQQPERAAVAVPAVPPAGAATDASPQALARPVQGRRVASSPAARRLARERGVQIDAVTGSGPGGRIVERDVPPRDVPGVAVADQPSTDVQVTVNAVSMLAALAQAVELGIPAVPAYLVVLAVARLVEGSIGWTTLDGLESGRAVLDRSTAPTAFGLAVADSHPNAPVDVLVIDASTRRAVGSLAPGRGSTATITVGGIADTVVVAGGGLAVQPQVTIALSASGDRWGAVDVFDLADQLAVSLEVGGQW